MLFYSKYTNLEVYIRDQIPERHPRSGDIIGPGDPALYVKFGKMGAQYQYTDPLTGLEMTGADIKGNYYDTDIEFEQGGQFAGRSAEDKEIVEKTLLYKAEQFPDMIQHIPREKAPAPAPWPTYDTTDAKKIPALAVSLGLVEEAIAYEAENLCRPVILEALDEVPEPEDDPEDEPDPVEEPEEAPAAVGNPKLITL